jgi:hypothetical protein
MVGAYVNADSAQVACGRIVPMAAMIANKKEPVSSLAISGNLNTGRR